MQTKVVQSEGLLEVDALDMEGPEDLADEAVLVKESDVVEQSTSRSDQRSRSMPVDLSRVQDGHGNGPEIRPRPAAGAGYDGFQEPGAPGASEMSSSCFNGLEEAQGVVVDDALAVSEPEEVEEAHFAAVFATSSMISTRFSSFFQSIFNGFHRFRGPDRGPGPRELAPAALGLQRIRARPRPRSIEAELRAHRDLIAQEVEAID